MLGFFPRCERALSELKNAPARRNFHLWMVWLQRINDPLRNFSPLNGGDGAIGARFPLLGTRFYLSVRKYSNSILEVAKPPTIHVRQDVHGYLSRPAKGHCFVRLAASRATPVDCYVPFGS